MTVSAQALAAARDIYAKRPQLLATLAAIPGLDAKTARKASAFLDRGFADLASDEAVTDKLLKTCL